MRKHKPTFPPSNLLSFSLLLLALILSPAGRLAAVEPEKPEKVREIFVPFKDLNVLLENQPHRVLLSREEYDALVKKAKTTPATHAPLAAALVAADYSGVCDTQRVRLSGTLSIDVLEDGLSAVPLDLGGVGLLSAKLDGRDAPIGREPTGRLSLLVEGRGRHALVLEMTAPLETTAARQILSFRLPRAAAGRLRLVAPGDVEVKSGADVAAREVDHAAGVTRFELLSPAGDATLVMSLNSHLQRREQAVAARSVLVDEVTAAYEKLHATVSLAILYRAVDHFRFVVPEGFEITEIASPLLSHWDIQNEAGRKIVTVHFREQTTESVVLGISAVRSPAPLAAWQFPRLEPLDVVGHVAVVGLLVEQPLKIQSLAQQGLIPVDAAVLALAMPAGAGQSAEAGAPLQAVAAYYAPQGRFSLSAQVVKPAAEMAVTGSVLLIVDNSGLTARGGWAMLPDVEKRFSFDFTLPLGWLLTGVTDPDQQPLGFERYGPAKGPERVHVRLPHGIPPGEEYRVYFQAVRTPQGWLADWKEQPVEFPQFAIVGASREEGAIAVQARDDITVRADKINRLVPLAESEQAKYGLANVAANLAYRYEGPQYAAALTVQRTEPRITAQTFSCFQVKPEGLAAHYELIYDVKDARARRLALYFPKNTPDTLNITGLGNTRVKESAPSLSADGKFRRWNVLLEEPALGEVRLAVDFQQPLPAQEPKDYALPIVRADDVAYQSGLVSVEGSAELDVQVKTPARSVDVGELGKAKYLPGRRLLGVFGFVGTPPALAVDVTRHAGYPLYPAIAQRAELTTLLAADGASQTQARFTLRTKALYLEVKLPKGAELWSAQLLGQDGRPGGMPLKPQREGDSLLVGLPAGAAGGEYDLQLVYAAAVEKLSLRGTMKVPAPRLLLRADRGTPAVEVPLADLIWKLRLPSGYEATRAGGTLVTKDLPRPRPAAVNVADALYMLAGGVNPFYGVNNAFTMGVRNAAVVNEAAQRRRANGPVVIESLGGESPQEAEAKVAAPVPAPPRAEKFSSMGIAKQSSSEKKIITALKSPTKLDCVEMSLQDVVDYLKDYHKIDIELDKTAMADVGISTDTKVTKHLKDMSLRSALRLMLRELKLTYVVQDDTLLITTPETAESHLVTKVYPVADLVVPEGMSQGEGQADFDSLIDTITSTVQPTTWDSVGGPGSISHLDTNLSLVLSQTQEVHEEIAELLENLREAKRVTGKQFGTAKFAARPRGRPRNGQGGPMLGGLGGMMPQKQPVPGNDTPFVISVIPVPEQAKMQAKTPGALNNPATAHTGEQAAGSGPFYTVVKPAYKSSSPGQTTIVGSMSNLDKASNPNNDESTLVYPDAKRWNELTTSRKEKYFDKLQGVSSLKIQLQETPEAAGNTLTFRSLGDQPQLVVTLANRSRLDALGWGLALAVGLWGLARTNRPAGKKVALVAGVMAAATLLPLVWDSLEVAQLCNMLFYAASLLVPYYLLVGAMKWFIRALCPRPVRPPKLPAAAAAALVLLLAVTLGLNQSAMADDADSRDHGPPVTLPEDAIIRPYDPQSGLKLGGADRLLVPYARYVELWNRAHPDKKLEAKPAPLPYALAGASYATTLQGDEYLLLSGRLVIEVYAQGYVEVPLGLRDGVLARAELDGQPARLRLASFDIVERPLSSPAAPSPAEQPHQKQRGQPIQGEHLRYWNASPQGDSTPPSAPPPSSQSAPLPAAKPAKQPSGKEINPGKGGGFFNVVEASPQDDPFDGDSPLPPQVQKTQNFKPQEYPSSNAAPPNNALLLLALKGKGRHTLLIEVRVRLSRQGGWRVAEAALPAAPAASLAINVPAGATEVRLSQVADRKSYDTEKAGQTITTALGSGGELSLRWRPKVEEAEVDRGLTSQSTATIDVQEDGLRVVWDMALEFRRSQREQFRLSVPKGYMVGRVAGDNVRGWEVHQAGKQQALDVTLLKAAKDHEQFTLYLWRGGAVGQGELGEFDLPLVAALGAAQATGQITIRRSPLMDVRTIAQSGVTRTDLDEAAASPRGMAGDESPLGIRPYQAYHFATVPYRLRLAAAPLLAKTTADVQSLVKFDQYERTLESRVILHVEDRPIFRVELFLPPELKLKQVAAPGEFQWALTERDKHPLLTIYLAAGRQGDVPVVVRGTLGRSQEAARLGLPVLEVCDVEHQPGDIAVQADPAMSVEALDLRGCQEVELAQVHAWLTPQQRQAARLALHYGRPGYSGTLRLAARKPEVTCETLGNIRVTDREVQETILLTFNVQNAGIRNFSFLLPADMADARISVLKDLLRQKTVAPVGEAEDAPLRVNVELQDEMMDQVRVQVENVRLLVPKQPYRVPIPTVETGRTDRQYITIERAGRDEVVVAKAVGIEPISRQQREWQTLQGKYPGISGQAYMVGSGARGPRLVFRTEPHEEVKVAGARIGLAETRLVMDANGAYRAAVRFHLYNMTEQFLKVELPEGAELWTAVVAGEPVKPTADPAAKNSRSVWVPLVKTAQGDLDYAVELKYGGKIDALGRFSAVNFPLVRTKNINIEQSVSQLHLPESHRWFNFGGTMRLVEQADVAAEQLSYQNKQAERQLETMQQADPYAQARVMNNFNAMRSSLDESMRQVVHGSNVANANLKRELEKSAKISQQAQTATAQQKQLQEKAQAGEQDNRETLTNIFNEQQSKRSRNVVKGLGANFSDVPTNWAADEGRQSQSTLNPEWFEKNDLSDTIKGDVRLDVNSMEFSRIRKTRINPSAQSQPAAPQIATGKDESEYQQEANTYSGGTKITGGKNRRANKSDRDQRADVERYQEKLQQQQVAQQVDQSQSMGIRDDVGYVPPSLGGMAPPPPPAPTSGLGVGVNSDSGLVGNIAAVQPGGLASLDFELPMRGELYNFITPRGDVAITADAVGGGLLVNLRDFGIALAALLLFGYAVHLVRQGRLGLLGSQAATTLMMIFGALGAVAGILPIAAVALFVLGLVLKLRRSASHAAAVLH